MATQHPTSDHREKGVAIQGFQASAAIAATPTTISTVRVQGILVACSDYALRVKCSNSRIFRLRGYLDLIERDCAVYYTVITLRNPQKQY